MEHNDKQTISEKYFKDTVEISTRSTTPEGFLDVQAIISRTGIQVYQAGELGIQDVDPAQQILVLRTADEVFKPESMNSFAKKPITVEHPHTLLDSSNTRYHSVGMSGECIVKDKNTNKTTIRITDKDAIESIEAGKVHLSCGYQADIIMGDGNDPEFGTFNARQTNIRGNHIAIVERGRAGDTCKIQDKSINDNSGVEKMKRVFRDVSIEVTEQGNQAIDVLQTELTDSNKALTDAQATHKADIDKLTTDHKAATDKLQGELDGAKDSIPDVKQLDKLVATRSGIVVIAKKIVKDYDPSDKTNSQIKQDVILHKFKDADLKDKSEDYIDGRFETIMDSFSKGDDGLNDIDLGDEGSPDESEAETAKKKMEKESEDAWKS